MGPIYIVWIQLLRARARARMCLSTANIRANCNNILTAYPDGARSLSFACRRSQFNKLRFYLHDNIRPAKFTGVNRRQNAHAVRSMLGPLLSLAGGGGRRNPSEKQRCDVNRGRFACNDHRARAPGWKTEETAVVEIDGTTRK